MYHVKIHWQDGRVEDTPTTFNPTEAKEHATDRIARNPAVIRRIEVHDNSGCFETIWDASWG